MDVIKRLRRRLKLIPIRMDLYFNDSSEIDFICNDYSKLLKELVNTPLVFTMRYDGFHIYMDNLRVIHIQKYTEWCNIPILDYKILSRCKSKRKRNSLLLFDVILHSILGKKEFRPKDIKRINLLIKEFSRDALLKYLSDFVGKRLAEKIVAYVEQRKYSNLIKMRKVILFYIILRKPKRIINILRYTVIKKVKKFFIKLFFGKLGLILVTVSGPDGVGKTTVAYLLKELFEKKGITATVIKMGAYSGGKISENRIAKKGSKFIPKWLKEVVRYAETFYKFLKCLSSLKKRKVKVVIFDRFLYDISYYSKTKVYKILQLFFPPTSIDFLLIAPPRVIWSRNKEYPLTEIKKTIKRMLKFFIYNEDIFILNTNQPMSNIRRKIKLLLFNITTQKKK